jgi:hypothetical protein
MAFEFIVKAVDTLILNKKTNQVVVYQEGKTKELGINSIVNSKYKISQQILNMLNFID